jgi:hypothetical protein
MPFQKADAERRAEDDTGGTCTIGYPGATAKPDVPKMK